MALAINAGDASVAFKDECAVVVDSAGTPLEKRKDDDTAEFSCGLLPFSDKRIAFFDSVVESFLVLFDGKVGRMAKFGKD